MERLINVFALTEPLLLSQINLYVCHTAPFRQETSDNLHYLKIENMKTGVDCVFDSSFISALRALLFKHCACSRAAFVGKLIALSLSLW